MNDAIESGLVKTPRVVVRDDAVPDAKTYKSRLYHIYNDPEVKDDLNRRAQPEEPLPDLVLNAYYLLGYDWREAWKSWHGAGLPTPPVMITVANRTETAARVKHAFDTRRIHIDELCDPERVLHIDSKVLDKAESQEEPVAIIETADDEDGEDFGVPFTFLPHEGGQDGPPPPPAPKTLVEPDPNKAFFEIQWPNVVRIDRLFQPRLELDWSKMRPLELNAAQTAQVAELAPILEGKPDVTKINRIELERLAREFRTQRIIFETARDVFDQMKHTWQGSRELLLAQLVKIVERFMRSDRIAITPALFYQDELRRRLIITLNMSRVVQHVWDAIRQENTERLTPVFDVDHPIRSTGGMRTWYTGKPCERTKKSHVNVSVYDSTREASDAFALDDSDAVSAWVKNDHLGFEILYIYRGVVRKYRPDFLIRLANGEMLVLETKGQDTEQDQVKRRYLDEWIQAVNAQGGFGRWRREVATNTGQIRDLLFQVETVATEG